MWRRKGGAVAGAVVPLIHIHWLTAPGDPLHHAHVGVYDPSMAMGYHVIVVVMLIVMWLDTAAGLHRANTCHRSMHSVHGSTCRLATSMCYTSIADHTTVDSIHRKLGLLLYPATGSRDAELV